MKLDRETIERIESALDIVDFGEIIIVIHDNQIKGIDTKTRRRHTTRKDLTDCMKDDNLNPDN
jgi:hypothetical protein